MTLSLAARTLFEALPEDGAKVGGITLQRTLEFDKTAYQSARDELKAADLVKVGGGRGGSLRRAAGAELPEPEKPEYTPPTPNEQLEHAREAKKYKNREQKYHDEIREIARKWCKENLNYEIRQANEIHLSYGRILVAVWRDDGSHIADMIQIPQLEVDKMRAVYVR